MQERGLIVENEEYAIDILKNISYFRLQGYWWNFQEDKENHKFKNLTTFNKIVEIYNFDRNFRNIIFEALEQIEIAFRTKLVYYLSIELDQWWFENENNFFSEKFYQESLIEIDKELLRSKEIFISAHNAKYGIEQRPPAYKTIEILSFGCLSKLYSNLQNEISSKKRIAVELNLPNDSFLKSWLQTFNIIRNIVAHHGSIYNRNIHFAPKFLHNTEFPFIEEPENKNSIYHCLSCILFILNKVCLKNNLKNKIIDIFQEYEAIDIGELGFPENWREQGIWK